MTTVVALIPTRIDDYTVPGCAPGTDCVPAEFHLGIGVRLVTYAIGELIALAPFVVIWILQTSREWCGATSKATRELLSMTVAATLSRCIRIWVESLRERHRQFPGSSGWGKHTTLTSHAADARDPPHAWH